MNNEGNLRKSGRKAAIAACQKIKQNLVVEPDDEEDVVSEPVVSASEKLFKDFERFEKGLKGTNAFYFLDPCSYVMNVFQ